MIKFKFITMFQMAFCLVFVPGFMLQAAYSDVLAGRAGGQSVVVAGEEKKPLVLTFENTVSGAKKNDWAAVEKAAGAVRKEIVSLDKNYGTGLMDSIDKTIVAKDAGQLLNLMANAVYLALREECKLAASDKFKLQDKALEHLKAARQYYEKILSVNITRKDPSLDKAILSAFESAVKSVENADEAGYNEAVQIIESSVLKVYVKFQQKKSDAGAVGMELAKAGQIPVVVIPAKAGIQILTDKVWIPDTDIRE